jgi:8-oxo-dGTP pyrophosphatase MutT (NUDIX family)
MERIIPTHAVKAVIINEQGDILFLQRNAKGRVDGKSNWDLPGGLVDEGEDDTALTREIEEELGRKAQIGRERGRWTFFRPFDSQTVAVTNYAATLDSNAIENLTLSDEHVGTKWVSRADLFELEVKDPSILTALGE